MHPEHCKNFTLHRYNNLKKNNTSNITGKEQLGGWGEFRRQQNHNSPRDLRNSNCTDKQNLVDPTDDIKPLKR